MPEYNFSGRFQTLELDDLKNIYILSILPIPGEAKAKAMPGWLYIHTINIIITRQECLSITPPSNFTH
jgi:hypothetical protein